MPNYNILFKIESITLSFIINKVIIFICINVGHYNEKIEIYLCILEDDGVLVSILQYFDEHSL